MPGAPCPMPRESAARAVLPQPAPSRQPRRTRIVGAQVLRSSRCRSAPSPLTAARDTAARPARVSSSAIAALQRLGIDPHRHSRLDPQVDPSARLLGKVDATKSLDAAPQESDVVLGAAAARDAVELFGGRGIDEHSAVALDVEHALHVEHIEGVVVAEGDRPRALAERTVLSRNSNRMRLSLRRTQVKNTFGIPVYASTA